MTLWYLPLEHLDARYTAMMDAQVLRALDRRSGEYQRVYGSQLTSDIVNGAFLDSEGTIYFKASQLQQLAQEFKKGRVKDGDKFFVSDLWFPGLEAIPYMAFFRGIEVEVWGIMHAGSWTDTDFVRALEQHAKEIERGWFEMCAGVFVGSEFHKSQIVGKGRSVAHKIHVTGLAFDTGDIYNMTDRKPKRDLVLLAGRLDDEKQPWMFDELARRLAGKAEFLKTAELGLNKAAYFSLLSEAKVVFSAALQENFGYAMLEAATLGAVPVVPNRLAYPEIWPQGCLYSDFNEAVEKVERYLQHPIDLSDIPARFNTSVDRMLDTMGL